MSPNDSARTLPEQFILDGECMLRVDHGEFVLAEDAKDLVDEINRLRADRRERIATACLAGKLACPNTRGNVQELAESAVQYADALVRALNKRAAQEAKP